MRNVALRSVLAGSLLLGLTSTVHAGGVYANGNMLLASCESPISHAVKVGECLGYLEAIVDSVNFNKEVFPNSRREGYVTHLEICAPREVSAGQLNKVWVKWANSHPEMLHLSATSLVMTAFAEAFPCTQ